MARKYTFLSDDTKKPVWSPSMSANQLSTVQIAWYCDTEAELPTTAEGASNLDWAFCLTETTTWTRTGGAWVQVTGGSGAPTTADYLVGTAQGGLSAEIVVGATPGGELGGTWGSPTVDSTHSGSAHHAQSHGNTDHTSTFITASDVTFENLDANADVGTGATQVAQGSHSHAGAGHTILDAGVAETQRANLDFQDGFEVVDNAGANSTDVDLSYGATGYPVDVAATEADGTAITVARADHQHAHGSGYTGGHTDVASHSGSAHTDPAAATTVDIGDTAAAGTGTNPPAADDHTHGFPAPGAGYPLDTTFAAEADGTATTPARSDHRHTITDPTDLPANDVVGTTTSTEGASTQVARANHAHGITAYRFSVGGMLDGAGASPATGNRMVWRAPFACTVVEIQGHVDVGTTTTVNARLNQTSNFLASDLAIAAANAWSTSSTIQNAAVAIDDDIEIMVQNAGTATKITIQVELTRP